jgi:Flp pilus assembly protein TadG
MIRRDGLGLQNAEWTLAMRHDLRTHSIPPVSFFALHRVMRGGRLLKSECGSGLVEYAVIIILFMTMLLGIADFSRALYAYHFVSSQAREAARYAMVRGCSTISAHCPTAATASDIRTFVKNVPLGIDASKVTVPDATWTPDHKPGSVVSVEVDYAFTFIFPFVSTSTLNFKSTSKMVIAQ